jgi:hypothetical protein
MNKLLIYFNYFVLVLAFSSILVVSFWLLYPYKTSTPNVQPYKIVTQEVKVGDTLLYQSDWCRFTDVPAEVDRMFVDSLVFSMPTVISQYKIGCYNMNIAVVVPSTLPEGKYKLKMIYRYKVNPIRTIIKIAETETFNIIK